MKQIPTIKAALLGAGTVGGGVYKLVQRQKDELPYKAGAHLEISRILVRNTGKARPGIPRELVTDDWQSILADPEIQIVIELMGGIEPAPHLHSGCLKGRKAGGYGQQGSPGRMRR